MSVEKATVTIEPGLYQFNMGGASLGECWRLGGSMSGFLRACYFKLVKKRMEYFRLPFHKEETVCRFDDLGCGPGKNWGLKWRLLQPLGFREVSSQN